MRRLIYVVITEAPVGPPRDGDGDSHHFRWISDDVRLTMELVGGDPEDLARVILDCKQSWDFKQGEEAKQP